MPRTQLRALRPTLSLFARLHPACRQCVMVPDPNLDPALCQEADQVLRSLEEFRPEQWGLPPFPAGGGAPGGAAKAGPA